MHSVGKCTFRPEKVAHVTLNGQPLDVAWTPPYAVTVPQLKATANVLEIATVNLWANRLIGDTALPPAERIVNLNTSENPFKKGQPLLPSGLYGPSQSAELKARGWTVVLDASGEALRLGVAAGPDLIKPNADECEPLVGFVPKTPDEFRRATESLRAQAAHVIISDGGAGAWFDGVFTPAPAVKVLDTTSAGDTLLAEYCWRAWGCGVLDAPYDAAKWAVAAGSAAVTMPGSVPPPIDLVEQLKENIR